MSSDVREFSNALVTIRGNSMRCANSVYSIRNIVSLTFDSVRKDNPEPYSVHSNYKRAKFFLKCFLLLSFVAAIFIYLAISNEVSLTSIVADIAEATGLKDRDVKGTLELLGISIPLSLLLSVLFFIIATWKKWTYSQYYYIHGLRVIFANNMVLYFRSDSDSGFIRQTIDGLQEIIASPEYRKNNEMVINFSNRNVNINKVEGSNIVAGDVQGDVWNG